MSGVRRQGGASEGTLVAPAPHGPARSLTGAALDGSAEPASGWGPAPALALAAAAGLAMVAGANALSRSGGSYAEPLFWAGLVTIVVPIAFRMTSADVPRGERIALVALFSLALYGVKVLHDPFAFTFADELVHQHNVEEILRTGGLFGGNSILPVTPLYPGLETATAALASVTGLSTFAAGLVLIAAGRLMLALALYLFIESVVGSPRAAGLAAVLYALAPNYLFFSAQFSYESLALPLAVVLGLAVARSRQYVGTRDGLAWGAVVLVLMGAIVVTHHLTAYAVVAFLVGVSALHALLPGVNSQLAPWRLAGAAAAIAVLWLVLVAEHTIGYLSPVLTRAIEETFETVGGEAATRTLFQGGESGGESTGPGTLERGVGIAAVRVVAAWVPLGLRVVWAEFRRRPPVVLLSLAAVAYLGTFALRLVPAAHETAGRASEFLCLGVGMVIALAAVERWGPRAAPWAGRVLVAAAAGLVVAGGFIAGWPPELRLAQPYRIDAGDRSIEPQGVAAADWMRGALGRGNRMVAEQADARLFQTYGSQVAVAGTNPPVEEMLHSPKLERWHVDLIRDERFRYAAVNRREVSEDVLAGYFFPTSAAASQELLDARAVAKLDRRGETDRLFDAGDIAIYDLGRLARGRRAR